ncbi:energy transducer TonB [Hymenobacter terrenus]|uniref:energy transducer TonB n=1 Tax=Hymenobacter terrenus TaxID=1629124 RepID=UPI00061954BD|nr:hypothetical protein [Hymenobacter terrenus]
MFILLALAIIFAVPVLVIYLMMTFWRLSEIKHLTGRAYYARFAWLLILAGGLTFIFYHWASVVATPIPSAHANGKSAFPWVNEHPLSFVLLCGTGVCVILMVHLKRYVAGFIFAAGVLLVVGPIGIKEQQAEAVKNELKAARDASDAYDATGWQKPVTDSFRLQVARRHDLPTPYVGPICPLAEPGLRNLVRLPRQPVHIVSKAGVEVEFIVEATGQIVLPHVTYGLGPGYDDEAVRVVRSLPLFSPALGREGKPIASIWRITVPFFN